MKITLQTISKMKALAFILLSAFMVVKGNYAYSQNGGDKCKYTFTDCPGDISKTSCEALTVTYDAHATHQFQIGQSFITYTHSFSGATTDTSSGTGSGSTFNPGTTTVKVYALVTGCTPKICTFTVKVTCPCTAPSFTTCPSNSNINTETGVCGAHMDYQAAASGTTPTYTYTFAGATSGNGSGTGSGSLFNTGQTTVTVTATNACGTKDCVFIITVSDTENPTAICKNLTLQLDATGTASITANDINNGSNDACGIKSIIIDKSSFDCTNLGANTVILTATDNNDNVSHCSSVVNVKDEMAPKAVCKNYTLNLTGGSATLNAVDIDGGSTDNCGVASISASKTSFTCSDLGANTVTLTVKDASGNTSTCDATVTVNDITAPNAICKNYTLNLIGGSATLNASDIDGGSTDNCRVASITASKTSFTCSDLGANTVTLTVKDVSGNTSTCDATVIVKDVTAPTAVCKNYTLNLTGGSATLNASDIDAGSTDNCGVASITASKTSFTCNDLGANTVTLTVKDASGNTSTCDATVTVKDVTAPTAVCKNYTLNLTGSSATLNASDIDGGSTDNCGIASITASQTSFICSNLGANTVTLTVKDASGNTSTCDATVTVKDVTAPTAVCKNYILNLIGGSATLNASDIDGGSTDNCGVASITASKTSFTCNDLGANTVTLTVKDASGNTSTCDALVTVKDVTAPTAVCKNYTLNITAGSATLNASDIDGGSTDNCGVASLTASKTSFTCSNLGANTVTLTVKDASGNTSTCNATVTIKDVTAPTAVCKNYTLTLSGGTATLNASNIDGGSSDNCGVASLIASKTKFTCSDIGDNTITLTVKDASGNTSTCNATVTVIGAIPSVEITQTSSDFCSGGSVELTANPVGGSSFTYLWSTNATTQVINVNSSGDYSVTATNNYGCKADDEFTVNYTSPSALSAYTIIATDEVELDDKSQVQSGGVGVFGCEGEIEVEGSSKITGTGTFARARHIEVECGSTVTTKYYTAINVTMPNFKYNPYCDDDCKSKYHNNCGSDCKNSNHVHCKSNCKEKNHSKRCHSKYHKNCNSNCKNSNHVHCKSTCKNEEHNHCGESNCDTEDHHHCSGHCHSVYHKNCNSNCKNNNHTHCKSNCNNSSHNHCPNSNCTGKNDITVGSNKTVTLTDSVYGKIAVGKNSTVIFTSPVIYLKELKTSEDVTIKFNSSCTEMMVCNGVELKDDNNFNSTGKSVLMYVEKDFKANENSTINSSIYSQDDIKVEGSCNNITKMKGMFVAENVKSKYTYWNKNTECGSCNQFHKRNEVVSEDLKGLIDPTAISFNVYPNPSKGNFGVDIVTSQTGSLKVTVIDLMGREMFTETQVLSGPVFVPVNLTGSTEGQYIVKAEINGQVFIKRLMLVK